MAFVEYTNLRTPNDVLSAMVTFLKLKGFTVVKDIADDMNIYDRSSTDGKKVAFKDKTGAYTIILRSANGTNIFGNNNDSYMDTLSPSTSANYYGVGMVVAEGYSNTQRWYNQFNAPLALNTGTGYRQGDVQGVWLPVPSKINTENMEYTLYCNHVPIPTSTVTFSLVRSNSKYKQVAHMSFANLAKYEDWEGGIIYSASANMYMIDTAYQVFSDNKNFDTYILPLYGCSEKSNTFLRIDIDEATTEERGYIYWACSGTDIITGKPLATPIRTSLSTNGKIPHYYYLESKSQLDSGMDVNTLNCITVNLPMFVAVRVDPDVLDNYAAVGSISGLYFISTLNVQTGGVYEMSYPESGYKCQVFPFGRRRGHFGFDGISIKQMDDV